MDPERSIVINGIRIEEYWWAGKFVVYVDHMTSDLTYEEACKAAEDGINTKKVVTL